MTVATEIPAYSHTQKAPLCLIVYGSALFCFVVAWLLPTVPHFPGNIIAFAVGSCWSPSPLHFTA
jgi:hypothetical protein